MKIGLISGVLVGGAVLAAITLLTGCKPEPTDRMAAAVTSNGRIAVQRIGVIEDDLAYGSRRGVYLVTDRTTGAEFVGVSGVGIAETGSHRSGKSSITDER